MPLTDSSRRTHIIDDYMPKIEEWVERSKGKVRADIVHESLVALGFDGAERTTRRAVADMKAAWQAGYRRTYRPGGTSHDVGEDRRARVVDAVRLG